MLTPEDDIPPYAFVMSQDCDIFWRDVSEDKSFQEYENLKREILVETDVTLRFASARDINPSTYFMEIFQEKALRYAFIN